MRVLYVQYTNPGAYPPLVRGAAVWALSRLAPHEVAQRQRATREDDPDVRAEWLEALQTVRGLENGP